MKRVQRTRDGGSRLRLSRSNEAEIDSVTIEEKMGMISYGNGSWRFTSLLGAMAGHRAYGFLSLAGGIPNILLSLFRDGRHGVRYSSRLFGVCRSCLGLLTWLR